VPSKAILAFRFLRHWPHLNADIQESDYHWRDAGILTILRLWNNGHLQSHQNMSICKYAHTTVLWAQASRPVCAPSQTIHGHHFMIGETGYAYSLGRKEIARNASDGRLGPDWQTIRPGNQESGAQGFYAFGSRAPVETITSASDNSGVSASSSSASMTRAR